MDEFSFPISLFLFAGICIAGSLYYNHQKKKARDKAWQQFAQANGLICVPGRGVGSVSYVKGDYKGGAITLETILKRVGKSQRPYTRFRLIMKIGPADDSFLSQFPIGHALSVEQVERLLRPRQSIHLLKQITIQNKGRSWTYEQEGYATQVNHIQNVFDLLAELAQRYLQLRPLGGDVVKALHELTTAQDAVLQQMTRQLLRDIADETTGKLKRNVHQLFCPTCLTGGTAHKIPFPWWQSLTYYGCRTCGQSRQFLKGPLIAVLDNRDEAKEQIEGYKALRVNWSRRRALFDFSGVAILQATDEEVERFAVQVGNDTDKYRKPRYAKMPCNVSVQCHLSENSMRILERMFGEVKVQ